PGQQVEQAPAGGVVAQDEVGQVDVVPGALDVLEDGVVGLRGVVVEGGGVAPADGEGLDAVGDPDKGHQDVGGRLLPVLAGSVGGGRGAWGGGGGGPAG